MPLYKVQLSLYYETVVRADSEQDACDDARQEAYAAIKYIPGAYVDNTIEPTCDPVGGGEEGEEEE